MPSWRTWLLLLLLGSLAEAQVFSPVVLRRGQPDPTDLAALARGIFERADAVTPRDKAEAIWRYFLTDGRFVKPGFWYHIAGWAYEEPAGEVLDPLKLLNSYGFGLCYQIAPLLEAVWEAGGFSDARVWFLTGHTVAEVFYDGAYHYFDSDMMGYTTTGGGPLKRRPVVSVRDLEQNAQLFLSRLKGPKEVNRVEVDDPWYPADVREGAIGGLAELFTSTADNRLFPFTRAPRGHSMDFVLRPGERMVRYFHPEADGPYYLPYKFDGATFTEFPREIARYQIRTEDGPRSQRDARRWATGRIDYRPPPLADGAPVRVIEMPCPYVIIDARFTMDVKLGKGQKVQVETSVDGGRTWAAAGVIEGPREGPWRVEPKILQRSEHGTRTAVSGSYGYLVRVTADREASVRNLLLTTRFQLNPRTLPELLPGSNELTYRAGPPERRHATPVSAERIREFAWQTDNLRYTGSHGQGYLIPAQPRPALVIFELSTPDQAELSGFEAGGRFVDLCDGLAPDKLTAEVRALDARPAPSPSSPRASLSWSLQAAGPWHELWRYDPAVRPLDGRPVDRILRWPEVDRAVRTLPRATRKVYVRYEIDGMAIDHFRVSTLSPAAGTSAALAITHVWKENGREKRHVQKIETPGDARLYTVDTSVGAAIENEALILEVPALTPVAIKP